ncbi:MAG: alanine--tRNA ligase-related protein, partial [Pseudomonadota bacterium]
EETLLSEETRFKRTLDRGLSLLDAELEQLDEGANLPGETAFKLYDTYGFPLDLTQDALRERKRDVDVEGFEAAMAAQKAKARAAWSGAGTAEDETLWFDLADRFGATDFLGYETEVAEGQVLAVVMDGAEMASAASGQSVTLVLNQTPFYGESGGQVGDQGEITTPKARVRIDDTRKKAGVFLHMGEVIEGVLEPGEPAQLRVDATRRSAICANHSATHLLHEALRRALGDHVAQRGSLVAEDRLRFDFVHQKAMDLDQIEGVERAVNDFIRQNAPVSTRVMTPDDAVKLGARALFGEKYGDEVRVVSMGDVDGGVGAEGRTYSLELCGGTHVGSTGEIGLFVLTGEAASSAGVRRVEGLTGAAAFGYLRAQDHRLAQTASALKARPEEVSARVSALMDERRALEREVADLRKQLALAGGGGPAQPQAEEVGGVPFLAQSLSGVSGKDLRGLIDAHKARLGSGAVVLVADTGGKAAVAAGVTDDLTDRVSAVDLVRAAAEAMGGKGGGGRPDMAQAGGADPSQAEAALAAARALLER